MVYGQPATSPEGQVPPPHSIPRGRLRIIAITIVRWGWSERSQCNEDGDPAGSRSIRLAHAGSRQGEYYDLQGPANVPAREFLLAYEMNGHGSKDEEDEDVHLLPRICSATERTCLPLKRLRPGVFPSLPASGRRNHFKTSIFFTLVNLPADNLYR